MSETNAPVPFLPVPSPRQLAWSKYEMYAFVHFTTNTFTGKEWGYGDEAPSVFAPTDFDADKIVRAVKEAGLKGLILTTKHHDGFCLWPSAYTDHSVKKSPWKGGRGDMVKEFSDACARYDVRFGVYLSPWDRNRSDYGTPAYVEYFRNQLRELLTNYGPIFEVWFDRANGGDGFYGGAREMRSIDGEEYYGWKEIDKLVRELQPKAVIWGRDVRWVGNERGVAPDPCWSVSPPPLVNDLTRIWFPAETNVSIRPGWFYHKEEDGVVKSPARLLKIYFESVGRGTSLLLNVTPDRRGLLPEPDLISLQGLRKLLDETFRLDLAQLAKVMATNERSGGNYVALNVLGQQKGAYWATDDDVLTPELVLEFKKAITFNVVDLREEIALGQRINSFALDYWAENDWHEFAAATAIGMRRIIPARTDITTEKVRFRITSAFASPALARIALYRMPQLPSTPSITRSIDGEVTISMDFSAPQIHYTIDGTEPTSDSSIYIKPIPLPDGAMVKARCISSEGGGGETVTMLYGIAKKRWKVVSATTDLPHWGDPRLAIDEDASTIWATSSMTEEFPPPQELIVDIGELRSISGFTYLPRQDDNPSGIVDRYEFYVSEDGNTWGAPAAAGEFSNVLANPVLQIGHLTKPVTGRFFRFVALRSVNSGRQASVAEFGILAAQQEK